MASRRAVDDHPALRGLRSMPLPPPVPLAVPPGRPIAHPLPHAHEHAVPAPSVHPMPVPSRRAVRDLWIGTLAVYGLLLVEDPGMLAVRLRLTDAGAPGWLTDVVLAVVMVGYNYAASRHVVGMAGSGTLATAMRDVDLRRAARVATTTPAALRVVRRTMVALNPCTLVKRVGETVGRAVDRLARRLHPTPLRPLSSWVEDLGMVNLVGVPAASLAIANARGPLSRRRSMRHSVLFVGSWFVGARVVGGLVGATHTLPGIGVACERATGAIGRAFAVVTDPTHPVGLVVLTLAVVAIARYAAEVHRCLRRAPHAVARSVPATPGHMAE